MKSTRNLSQILRDGTVVDRAIEAAQRHVMERHRRLGIPLAIWRSGRVAIIPADKIAALERQVEAGLVKKKH